VNQSNAGREFYAIALKMAIKKALDWDYPGVSLPSNYLPHSSRLARRWRRSNKKI
jgi:hypothetical protein